MSNFDRIYVNAILNFRKMNAQKVKISYRGKNGKKLKLCTVQLKEKIGFRLGSNLQRMDERWLDKLWCMERKVTNSDLQSASCATEEKWDKTGDNRRLVKEDSTTATEDEEGGSGSETKKGMVKSAARFCFRR